MQDQQKKRNEKPDQIFSTVESSDRSARPKPKELTPTEAHYLRLVATGLTSKEIAKARHIRSDSVDKTVLRARRKLGDMSRRAAARTLPLNEEMVSSANLSDTPSVSDRPQFLGQSELGLGKDAQERSPTAIGPPGQDVDHDGVGTNQTTRVVHPDPGGYARRVLHNEGQPNDMAELPRLALIAFIMTMIAFAAGAVLSLLSALDGLVSGH